MNDTIYLGLGALALGALYFLYKPLPTAYATNNVSPVPPMVPSQQDPNAANAFCKQVVSTAATAVATYYGGAAGGAAAQKTGASAGAGVGVCATVSKIQDVQSQFSNYVANALPPAVGKPLKTIADNAIKTSNPFYDVQHPIDAAKSIVGATGNALKSVASTISSWF